MDNNMYKVVTHEEEETIELAQNIESEKFPNMVICLNGDLGSGKTVFTKAFASAMAPIFDTCCKKILLKYCKYLFFYQIYSCV